MNNGSNFDPLASYARLSERVENQGRDIVDLRSNMNTGFRNIEGAVNALSTELRGSSKTQWPVLLTAVGVAFTILVAAGSQALSPIRESVTDTKTAVVETNKAIATLASATISRQEMDWRAARGQEDRIRTDTAIADLRTSQVPRLELDRVFQGYDQRFADQQRQIDDANTRFGNTYTLGDYIKRLTDRIDALEQRALDRRSPPT
ncbi:hypothetical protein FJ872_32000 [Mesorhizobium sp. B2-5-9]|uniref:hypothetical protein n=1 Tax=Mesorhizobium sp. B2-5-9 TaxID=2589921 RepID=UPI00112DDF6D|nr:hypothetical protein [Mesorhizobium sp. B2-5-9]TPJ97638.1 hypothetical protein FJ872_32000 [Mesorhizobium sp. B2-5-9]